MKKIFVALVLVLVSSRALAGESCYLSYKEASHKRDQLRGILLITPITIGTLGLLSHDNTSYKYGLLSMYGLTAIASDVLPANRYRKVLIAYESSATFRNYGKYLERLTDKVNRELEVANAGLQVPIGLVAKHLSVNMNSGDLCPVVGMNRRGKPVRGLFDLEAIAKKIAADIEAVAP